MHLAPACGTASRAREKNLTSFAKRGFKIPGPLRSQKQPMGIDGLSGLGKVRTEIANLVYAATAKLIEVCHNLQILCSVENPENPLFGFFQQLQRSSKNWWTQCVIPQLYAWRSSKQATEWWATDKTFEALRVFCDNSHGHAKWNPVPVGKYLQFPTAAEAAYPNLLCKRIMAILLEYALQHGAPKPVTLQTQLPLSSTTSHRWVLDMLSKGKKLKPLVSEFKDYVFFLNAVNCDPEDSAFFSTTDSMRDEGR